MTFKQKRIPLESYNYCNHQNFEGKKNYLVIISKSKTIKTSADT
jgi:hypothetical protein